MINRRPICHTDDAYASVVQTIANKKLWPPPGAIKM